MDYASWQATTWGSIFRDLFIALVLNDTGFYWSHRALHTRSCISEFTNSITNSRLLFRRQVNGLILLRISLGIFYPRWRLLFDGLPSISCCFLAVVAFVEDYGCTFRVQSPFSLSIWHGLPGMLGSEMHDFHHESKEGMNSCFGAMTTFWDSVCGTDKAFHARRSKAKGRKGEISCIHLL